jgi:hypothetical protein
MGLTDLLAAAARAGIRSSHKAIIMVFLPGGSSHQDMFGLKPDAPSEIRGEFKPIATNVAGIQICEHLPRLAVMMDKLTLIRSLVGARDVQDLHDRDLDKDVSVVVTTSSGSSQKTCLNRDDRWGGVHSISAIVRSIHLSPGW